MSYAFFKQTEALKILSTFSRPPFLKKNKLLSIIVNIFLVAISIIDNAPPLFPFENKPKKATLGKSTTILSCNVNSLPGSIGDCTAKESLDFWIVAPGSGNGLMTVPSGKHRSR